MQDQEPRSDNTPRKFLTMLTPGMLLEIKATPFPWPSDDPTRVNVHTELFGLIEKAHIETQEVVPGTPSELVLVIEKMQVRGLSIAGMATAGEPPSNGFRLVYGVKPDDTFSIGSDGELTWIDVNRILPHLWSQIKGEPEPQEGRRLGFCCQCGGLTDKEQLGPDGIAFAPCINPDCGKMLPWTERINGLCPECAKPLGQRYCEFIGEHSTAYKAGGKCTHCGEPAPGFVEPPTSLLESIAETSDPKPTTNYGDPPDGCPVTGRGGSHSESFYEGGACIDCGMDSVAVGYYKSEDGNGQGT